MKRLASLYLISIVGLLSQDCVSAEYQKRTIVHVRRQQRELAQKEPEQAQKDQLALLKYTYSNIEKNMPYIRGIFEFAHDIDPNVSLLSDEERMQFGGSPLHNAARAGNVEVVQLLLDKGAFATQGLPTRMKKPTRMREYNTPLHEAVRGHAQCGDYPKVVELLRMYGANVNCGGATSKWIPLTPLMVAVLQKKPNNAVIEQLLLFGDLKLNKKSYGMQQEAAHLAAKKGHHLSLMRLYHEGASMEAKDKSGLTPIDLLNELLWFKKNRFKLLKKG